MDTFNWANNGGVEGSLIFLLLFFFCFSACAFCIISSTVDFALVRVRPLLRNSFAAHAFDWGFFVLLTERLIELPSIVKFIFLRGVARLYSFASVCGLHSVCRVPHRSTRFAMVRARRLTGEQVCTAVSSAEGASSPFDETATPLLRRFLTNFWIAFLPLLTLHCYTGSFTSKISLLEGKEVKPSLFPRVLYKIFSFH